MNKRNHRYFALGMMVVPLALLGLAAVYAGSVSTPNTFVSGTPALAAEVNANFTAHATEINDNDSRIAALESPSRRGSLRAFVSVGGDGTVRPATYSNTGMVTVTKPIMTTGEYLINFSDIAFFDHTIDPVTATSVGSFFPPAVVHIGGNPAGDCVVRLFALDGSSVDQPFTLTLFHR